MEMPPDHLRYAPTHEWVDFTEDGDITVGITDFAQDQLGDVVFVSLPEPGTHFEAGEVCMMIESVKSASDIHMPISGTIVRVNKLLDAQPELINQDAFEAGWLFSLNADETDRYDHLLDSHAYDVLLDE